MENLYNEWESKYHGKSLRKWYKEQNRFDPAVEAILSLQTWTIILSVVAVVALLVGASIATR